MTKLKNTNWDKNLRLELWQNSKTQNVIKLKYSVWQSYDSCDNSDSTDNSDIFVLKIVTTQKHIVTKLKNSNYDKSQKLNLWQNSKIQIVTKLKTQIRTKLNNSNCDQTQILKLWQT